MSNCAEHMWPRGAPGGSLKSIGRVDYEQCNNCLAMRITFTSVVRVDGKWVRVTDTKVVEPDFDLSTGVPIGESGSST